MTIPLCLTPIAIAVMAATAVNAVSAQSTSPDAPPAVPATGTDAAAPASPPSAETTLPAVKVKATASTHLDLRKDGSTGALGDKPVLDTPFSISVVSEQDIAARGARSISQIFAKDASVYTPSNSYTTDWWGTQIRGLGVRNMYVDDVPVLLYWGGDFPVEAAQSVTALKGLTGFMYGFGEPGGAISYQLKRPTGAPETTLTLGYRNPRLATAHLDTSHRFGDAFGLRFNLATERGTAYNAAEIDRTVASLALDKRLGASLLWETTFLHEDSKNTGEPFQFYLSRYDVAGSGGALPDVHYDYDKYNIDNSYYKTKTSMATTGLRWEMSPDWSLRYQLGFTRKDHASSKSFAYILNRAGDYSGTLYAFGGRLDNLFTQATATGRVETGPVRHEIATGVGLQRATDRWTSEFRFENDDFTGNFYVDQPYRESRPFDYSLLPVSNKVNQLYTFASDTLHFGPHWQAIVGLRYTHYDSEDMDRDPAVTSGYQVGATTPTLALIYKPTARSSLYGSYVEGLEPGTRVGPPYANDGDILEATVSRQAELGFKLDGETLDLTAALFQINRANQIDEMRGAQRFLTQDGRVVYRGLEVEANVQATRSLEVGASATYLDAKIDRVSTANAALKGNRPSNAPEWQVVGHASYKVPAVSGLTLQGNWRYFGASYVADDNRLEVPGRHVLNAGLSYDFPLLGRSATLHANVNNLLDEKYWASGGWGAGNPGEARNLSLTLVTTF